MVYRTMHLKRELKGETIADTLGGRAKDASKKRIERRVKYDNLDVILVQTMHLKRELKGLKKAVYAFLKLIDASKKRIERGTAASRLAA